jgi:hypothetical protein
MNYLQEEIPEGIWEMFNNAVDSVDGNEAKLVTLEKFLLGELAKVEELMKTNQSTEILEINNATLLLMLNSINLLKLC